ncbi:MAG: FumA C-terminus/TtdB family hydratase beta subunit [Elusimicrobiales bacterium]
MKFRFKRIIDFPKPKAKYRLITDRYVEKFNVGGRRFVKVEPKALEILAETAFRDIEFLYRERHLKQIASILEDPQASDNDKYIAYLFLENAIISRNFELPLCQDTGTATVIAKKGDMVFTGVDDERYISKGIFEAFQKENLRYSQTIPLNMYDEKNSGTNLPAQIEIYSTQGDEYEFLFIAKGGGSANKTFLYQETAAILTPQKLKSFLVEKMRIIGTAACPPYHLVFVIGGTSADYVLKTVKLASTGYLDGLPTKPDDESYGFRDLDMEEYLLDEAYKLGLGAQFGGKYFALDVRVIRLPRHGASCPIGVGVSCMAHRQAIGKIDEKGVWLEELCMEPERFMKDEWRQKYGSRNGVIIDLNKPMSDILKELSKYPVGTRLLLNGRIVVARDLAHKRFKEMIDAGKKLPDYLLKYPIYYAGPAKKPYNKPSGSMGPTTAGRMDSYVELLQSKGASLIMIAKGNRSQAVTDSCKKYGGFYLGSPGGPAAYLAEKCIKKVDVVDFADLGMEAVWMIEVSDFPAFIIVDDKGNDLYVGGR